MGETDYDQNLLAEKYIQSMGLSDANDQDQKYKMQLVEAFDNNSLISLIKSGLSLLDHEIPVECALDIGCGQGRTSKAMIEEKIAHRIVCLDKSKNMIEYAKLNCKNEDDENPCYEFKVMDASEDLKNSLNQKFPVVFQVYMLCHADDVNQLSRILSNIFQICNGIFVGIVPNPFFDEAKGNIKLLKYGMKKICGEKIDGQESYFVVGIGTPSEVTIPDRWYNAETYERLFKQAGFRHFEWVPMKIDQNKLTKEEQEYVDDYENGAIGMGFIAVV